jgi:hypothetical protein
MESRFATPKPAKTAKIRRIMLASLTVFTKARVIANAKAGTTTNGDW